MTSGADLFVVCKQCGSEVSPYITECPYCGSRVRRRAPKLPRVHGPSRPETPQRAGRLRKRRSGDARRAPSRASRWSATRPHVTIAIVAASAVMWVLVHAIPSLLLKATPSLGLSSKTFILGPLAGDWWKLLTYQFAYLDGGYAFAAILTVAIFGWLVEQRHGPGIVIAVFFGAGVIGALIALAAYPLPIISGANAGALALLGAWAAPDLMDARAARYYEGDLLGAGAMAALMLALPFVVTGASWLAGVSGAVVGLAAGVGLRGSADA